MKMSLNCFKWQERVFVSMKLYKIYLLTIYNTNIIYHISGINHCIGLEKTRKSINIGVSCHKVQINKVLVPEFLLSNFLKDKI